MVILLIKINRYSATSLGEDKENIIVFSGTVFREIVIWSPFRRCNGSNILHRLQKHEVSITFLQYDTHDLSNCNSLIFMSHSVTKLIIVLMLSNNIDFLYVLKLNNLQVES